MARFDSIVCAMRCRRTLSKCNKHLCTIWMNSVLNFTEGMCRFYAGRERTHYFESSNCQFGNQTLARTHMHEFIIRINKPTINSVDNTPLTKKLEIRMTTNNTEQKFTIKSNSFWQRPAYVHRNAYYSMSS